MKVFLGCISKFFSLYKVSTPIKLIEDAKQTAHEYRRWQIRMFLGMFFGYAILYFSRKNISTVIPSMGEQLQLSNVDLGIIGTALYVTYGIGKFVNGILADRCNIKVFMATGLIGSGILNLIFGTLSSLWLLVFIWGLNGWFQSMGFPPIARGMTLWFSPKGKASRWAFWTCSHQLGTFLIMFLTGVLLTFADWRYCFFVPGFICILMGILCLLFMADTPESKGLSSHIAFEEDARQKETKYVRIFIRKVLLNRNVWAIGLVDMCVYVVRYGTLDWTTKFLIEEKGYALSEAAFYAGIMPFVGIIGVLVAGFSSDVIFRGRYKMVNALSLVLLIFCLMGIFFSGRDNHILDFLFLAGIGFFVEGPQSILGGVGAVDAGGSAKVASSSAGLVGVLAYIGASLSGFGTGWFVEYYQWVGAFIFWIGTLSIGFAICMLMWEEKRS